ncbi:hypothetical protein FBU30_005392 [Linnemannia zychae]|nr:hypothetical protein FBU30_005392 [Linnemannia zychae]
MSYIPSTTSTSAAPTVIPILTPSKGPNKLSAGAITGIVIGGVTGFLILTLLGFLVWRRQHAQDTRYYPDSPPMQETHHTAYGDGGGGGGDQIMARNSGAGLEVTSNNSNIPYGGGFMPSHDQIISTPTDTEHSLPSQSTGYEHNNASSLVIPVSGLYDYGNEYDFQHQTRLQPRPQRPYLPPNQPLSYTPPTEPGFAPENRYDPNYAARQAQEAAYMNYQQRQLYLQSQRRLLQQRQKQQQYLAGQSSIPAPMIPSEEVNNSRSDAVGSNNAEEFNPQNRFSVASTNSQEYLDRLRGDYPPATINQNLMSGHSPTADGATSVVENIGIPNPIIPPSSNFSGPQYQGLTSSQLSINPTLISNDATGTSEGMAQFNNYAYPESDARRTVPTSVVTVEPPNQPITNNPETMAVTTGDIQESRLTPPMELRHIEDRTEGEYNSGFPKRSSVASQTPSAVSSPNSKRSPQVLYPEEDN